jgi:hypothetical protein
MTWQIEQENRELKEEIARKNKKIADLRAKILEMLSDARERPVSY